MKRFYSSESGILMMDPVPSGESVVSAAFTVGNNGSNVNQNLNGGDGKSVRANGSYGIIDDLTYRYHRSSGIHDRLLGVLDAGDREVGYVTPESVNNIRYDGAGNMLDQPNKGISQIDYTVFNLPRRIRSAAGLHRTVYDGLGQKIVHVDGASNERTDYIDGIEIVGGNLHSISHEEGRVVKEGSQWKYEYVLTDHLGNTRVVFRKNSGLVETVSEHTYYPFGMEIGALTETVTASPFDYRYNGKELNTDLGLYDYGARWYDPAIARFTTTDPLADQFPEQSPYHYAYNNPLRFIDPDGRSADDIIVPYDKKVYANRDEYNRFKAQTLQTVQKLTNDPLTYDGDKIVVDPNGETANPDKVLTRGTEMVGDLINETENHTKIVEGSPSSTLPVKKGAARTEGEGSASTVRWDPSKRGAGMNTDGTRGKEPFVVLGHELGHADANRQGLDDNTPQPNVQVPFARSRVLDKGEINARFNENIIRREQGLPARLMPIPRRPE